MIQPSVLCPIDFSESSRGALRYAGVLAAQLGYRLTLLAVIDPLLQEADEFAGSANLAGDTTRALQGFFSGTFARSPLDGVEVRHMVATGKPAPEILRVSQDDGSAVVVMSSHGLTGFRKMFFGSTTERVLRETTVPVLVTPGNDPGPEKMEDVPRLVRRVMVPVDLTPASLHQLQTARLVSQAVHVPLLVLHVVEPVRAIPSAQARLARVDGERRYRAERELQSAMSEMPSGVTSEALVTYGEPAEEIAKVAADRDVGAIVMGLHSSVLLGPRMGSVTYRVLCLAHRLVLAVPPAPAAPPHEDPPGKVPG